ncbi:hypothetical protein CPBP_00229 [Candidatus Bodocaedibacter vickermanii]|uniref:Uncharacterized protein n=2 Tax=Candidatus Bodocaedibacter vickermanii TaxID=2741701 RepID=A0A7L9RS84_9PROT|nr:hypothetical protein CPBP_00229 [Candidatus Paracaedibacteraceae bacterium 'Lake Konstanz']
MNFTALNDLNSHLNLSTHLQDKFASIPTTALDTSEIVTQLKLIASAVASPCWWTIGTNLAGILISAITLWAVTVWYSKRKEKKDNKSKILAALASFESTKISILDFKKTYIDNEQKNKFRRIIEKKEPGNEPILLKIEKIFLEDRFYFINEFNADSENYEKYQTGPRGNIKHEFHLLNIFFDKPYPTISYHIKPWSKDLHFISNVNPNFLITLDQTTEKLSVLNTHINNWNNLIENDREKTILRPESTEYYGQYVLLKKYLQFIFDNSESSLAYAINQVVEFNQTAIEHLIEYAKEIYPSEFKKGHFNLKYPFENEAELMPKKQKI